MKGSKSLVFAWKICICLYKGPIDHYIYMSPKFLVESPRKCQAAPCPEQKWKQNHYFTSIKTQPNRQNNGSSTHIHTRGRCYWGRQWLPLEREVPVSETAQKRATGELYRGQVWGKTLKQYVSSWIGKAWEIAWYKSIQTINSKGRINIVLLTK